MHTDLVALCAHPDDAELMLGGTLSLEASRGRNVAIVDLTAGELGSRGDRTTRAREAEAATRVLGIAHRECLGLPDAGITVIAEHKDRVIAALRRLQPTTIALHHWAQGHPDHAAASRLCADAAYLSGLVNYRPDLGAPFRPSRIVYCLGATQLDVAPSFVIDISDRWNTKLDAIRAYASQIAPPPGSPPNPLDRVIAQVETAARYHGSRIGVAYGEAFVMREPVALPGLVPA
jgi:N-acetylglucosamine malate deacetylase 1